MHQSSFVILALLCAVCIAQDAPGACNFNDAIDPFTFNVLIQKIGSSGDRIGVLKSFVSNLTLGFNTSQVVSLFKAFPFSSERLACVPIANKFVLTLSASGLVDILTALTFSDEKFAALTALVNLTNQVDLQLNVQKVVGVFFGFDQDKAKKIIQASSPRSCVFGDTSLARFAFIIDVSGSMSYTFKDLDGKVYSRLQYVQRDLTKLLESSLSPTQEFNVIQFSSSAYAWQQGVVPVNKTSIQSAQTYVQKLVPDGGTYMLGALKLAFSDPRVLGVYFLSDGDPSDSRSDILNFLAMIKKPCNTIAFKADNSAQQFMLQMAKTSGGTFRAII